MTVMTSTKITKGGQTTIPKEIRTALGVSTDSRVFWSLNGTHAIVSAEPLIPNTVFSEDEFWQGIDAAMRDVEAGRLHDAASVSAELREKYGI